MTALCIVRPAQISYIFQDNSSPHSSDHNQFASVRVNLRLVTGFGGWGHPKSHTTVCGVRKKKKEVLYVEKKTHPICMTTSFLHSPHPPIDYILVFKCIVRRKFLQVFILGVVLLSRNRAANSDAHEKHQTSTSVLMSSAGLLRAAPLDSFSLFVNPY